MAESIAVLTGDLIRSTDYAAGDVSQAMDTLANCAADIDHWIKGPVAFARARGDGWQMALSDPALCLRACFLIRARLRATPPHIQSRIAVAVAAGRFSAADDLNAANDPAFVLSGRCLEGFSRRQALGFIQASPPAPSAAAAFHLADLTSRDWTQAQAAVLALMLPPNRPTQAEAAETLGIQQQTVQKTLLSVGFDALSDALAAYEGAATSGAQDV